MSQNESEFGGAGVNRAGVYPVPHIPTAAEQLSLMYRTGDPSGLTNPDDGQIWSGLRKEEPMRTEAIAAGKFDKGEYAQLLTEEAQAQIRNLQDLAVPE